MIISILKIFVYFAQNLLVMIQFMTGYGKATAELPG